MKKWFILVGIIVVLLVGGYFILTFYSVKLLQPYLREVFGPGLTLKEIRVRTTSLSVRGIRFEDPHSKQKLIQIEEVRIYPSLFTLLEKTLYVKEFIIFRPSFFFYRTREGVYIGPWVTMQKNREREISSEGKRKEEDFFQIRIDRFRIQKGSIHFEDRKVGSPPAYIKLKEVNFEIRDIRYPFSPSKSPVELKGKLDGETKEGDIHLKGWIEMNTLDLETSLKIQEIEVKTSEPYYRKKFTAGIDTGYIHTSSQIVLKGRKINAIGELDLVNLKVKGESGMVFWIPIKTFSTLLEQKKHHLHIPFTVNGDLDNPQFNFQEALLTQIAFYLGEALGTPVKTLGKEVVRGASKEERGFLKELKPLEDFFKKKR